MFITTPCARRATPSNSRTNFARAAVFEAFGRHARALDYNGFADRPSNQAPQLIYAARRRICLPSLGTRGRQ